MIISVYSKSDGEFIRYHEFSDDLLNDVTSRLAYNEGWIAGKYEFDTHRMLGGQPVAKPPKPFAGADWDGVKWLDNRDPEHEVKDAQKLIAISANEIRQRASLTKLQFVMAVVQAGIISQASGLAMLDGTLPTELAGMTVGMTDMEKFELSAKLKGAQQIDRMDPFIIASGQFLGMTDEQIDAVFGIQPPD